MSQLFRQIPKSYFSTATARSWRSKPYLLLGGENMENTVNVKFYDPTSVMNNLEKYRLLGSSRGWLALKKIKEEYSDVYLASMRNELNPNQPNILSLPPLRCDLNENPVVNVSVSSPLNTQCNDSVTVAVKFFGSRLNLCRFGDSEWTRIDVPFPSSPVSYSERDKRFYLINLNPRYTGPIDFNVESNSGLVTPVSAPICTVAKLPKYEKDLSVTLHGLVESPSGQSFIVCWDLVFMNEKGEIAARDKNHLKSKDICLKTHKIRVFKQIQKEKIAPYTEDIRDLCIFIGQNESFCVSANEYPGLNPNSVYFAGTDFGVCDLSSGTIQHFSDGTDKAFTPSSWIVP